MKKEKIIVLGASGSIGLQTLDLLKDNPNFELVAITFNSRYENIEPYLNFFPSLKFIGIVDTNRGNEFKNKYSERYFYAFGEDINSTLLNVVDYDSVVNSIMGNAGLVPTIETIKKDKTLYLANKESLIIGGFLVKEELRNHPAAKLYPIDSEHVALNKLINHFSKENKAIDRYFITASGGALREYPLANFENVTPEIVLNHPTWSMGSKITIDSATMVNKAYEMIEANILFDIPFEKLEAIVCYQSTLHAAVILKDEDIMNFDYSANDMHLSIAFALSKGTIEPNILRSDDELISSFTFKDIDDERYPLFNFILNQYKEKGNFIVAVINTVDEIAINYFLNKKIKFTDIRFLIETFANRYESYKVEKIEDIVSLIYKVKKETIHFIEENYQ